MTQYLTELSTRGFEDSVPAIRPRSLSRYEADPGSDEANDTESMEVSSARPVSADPLASRSNTPAKIQIESEPPSPRHESEQPRPADDFGHRINQLNRKIDSLSLDQPFSGQVTPQVNQTFNHPITNLETHLHHQQTDQHLHSSEVIQNTQHTTVNVRDTERVVQQTETIPAVSVDPIDRASANQIQQYPQESVVKQVESVPQDSVPQIILERLDDRGVAAPVNEKRNNAVQQPQITVEKPTEPSPSHTVTVTIGRIEVRSPKKESAPAPRTRSVNPRIMTLDDYIRQRSGGGS